MHSISGSRVAKRSRFKTDEMQSLLTSLLVGAAAASRANLCFTAHGKTSLQCTQTLLDGPIAVYDDSQSPQKARTYHYSKRVGLCQQKGCKRCMAPGGAWVACGSSAKLPVYVMGANGDWAKPKAIAFAALLVALPIGVFLVLGKPASQRVATSNGSNSESGPGSSVVSFLLRFASAPWFPLVAAFGTAVNMFTIVFTGSHHPRANTKLLHRSAHRSDCVLAARFTQERLLCSFSPPSSVAAARGISRPWRMYARARSHRMPSPPHV